jgi:MscS family membrane protein
MFEDFFTRPFYGNTVGDWFIAVGIILISIILAKAVYWVFGNILKRLSSRSETRLDDIIIDKVEEPVAFGVIIAGIWFGLSFLYLGEGMDAFVHKVYYVLIIFNIAWMVIRLFDAILEEYLAPVIAESDSTLDDQLLPVFRKGVKFALWLIAFILALNNAGYDVGALLAGLGIGGLAFALAAQDLVKNLFGGLTIFLDKPFMVGDRIDVAGFDGIVEEIGIRSLRIRTLDGRVVVIPNSDVANDAIQNITSEPNRKVVLNLGLTYDTDDAGMTRAVEILKDIVANNDQVEDKEIAGFNGFGDFSLNILFIYYIKKEADIIATQNEINLTILRRFSEAGLDFAFPTQTIITQKG